MKMNKNWSTWLFLPLAFLALYLYNSLLLLLLEFLFSFISEIVFYFIGLFIVIPLIYIIGASALIGELLSDLFSVSDKLRLLLLLIILSYITMNCINVYNFPTVFSALSLVVIISSSMMYLFGIGLNKD